MIRMNHFTLIRYEKIYPEKSNRFGGDYHRRNCSPYLTVRSLLCEHKTVSGGGYIHVHELCPIPDYLAVA